jgi:TonB family protein
MPTILRASFAAVLFLLASVSLAQTPPASGPYRVGGEVTRPEKISGEEAVYKEAARRAGIAGIVILEAVIDEQGNVTKPRVLKGLPMGLDLAAVEAVETWKFKPATLDGRPVPVYYVVTVNFQLKADFSFGPRFAKLMEDNPGFGELVREMSYEKALGWLEGRPASSESRLARSYLLLGLGRVPEAWEEARVLDSPEHELLSSFGEAARDRAAEEQDEEKKAGILDAGIQALSRALELKKDDYWMLSDKSRLLREKAELTTDQQERQALIDEAERLSKRAGEVRAKTGMPNDCPP